MMGTLPLASGYIGPLMEIIPVTLQGIRIRLEPLALDRHFEGLAEIGLDPELWRWTLSVVETREDLLRYLEEALRAQAERKALPFATVDRASSRMHPIRQHRARAPPGRDRMDLGRPDLSAHPREFRGEIPDAEPCL